MNKVKNLTKSNINTEKLSKVKTHTRKKIFEKLLEQISKVMFEMTGEEISDETSIIFRQKFDKIEQRMCDKYELKIKIPSPEINKETFSVTLNKEPTICDNEGNYILITDWVDSNPKERYIVLNKSEEEDVCEHDCGNCNMCN